MNKTTLTIVVALIVVAVGAWYWATYLRTTPEERALTEAADLLAESATAEDLSSVVDTSVNPVGEAPDANPLSQTNPFAGVKTNPFEQP